MEKQHDQDFTQLWQEYCPKLMVFVRSFFPEMQDREDAVQEIFTRIFKARAQYNPRFSTGTWIYRIARNYCIDCSRHKKRLKKLQQDFNAQYTEQNQVFNPEDQLIHSELKEKIRAFIMAQDKTDQQICYLYHYENLNYEEIARAMRIPAGTLRYRMHTLRSKIKKEMEAYYAGTTR